MDCPSEENLIRMKLDDLPQIKHLQFNINERKLTIYHKGQHRIIMQQLDELKLGAQLFSTEKTQESTFEKNHNQRKALWSVLIINFAFFGIEITTGVISKSMGLVADSLDMLADSFVYGISIFAIGRSLTLKKRVAKIAGYFQMTLAVLGFAEVLRRFWARNNFPISG